MDSYACGPTRALAGSAFYTWSHPMGHTVHSDDIVRVRVLIQYMLLLLERVLGCAVLVADGGGDGLTDWIGRARTRDGQREVGRCAAAQDERVDSDTRRPRQVACPPAALGRHVSDR